MYRKRKEKKEKRKKKKKGRRIRKNNNKNVQRRFPSVFMLVAVYAKPVLSVALI